MLSGLIFLTVAACVNLREIDGDGDGAPESADCDDQNKAAFPGATEACDGFDNDCDGEADEIGATGESDWFFDGDLDGFGDDNDRLVACTAVGYVATPGDCDDAEAELNPSASELCDGADNDCDGLSDEPDAEDAPTYYLDFDADGHGSDESTRACTLPAGYSELTGDCDDDDATAFSGGVEVCDGADNNCDGATDEGVKTQFYPDNDGDGHGDGGNIAEACEAPAGFVATDDDCDDANPEARPDGIEVCDDVDNDCDSEVDETVKTTFYADADGDGFGELATTSQGCAQPDGFASVAGDCDDSSSLVFPGAAESCDGTDDDCDGTIDEDVKITFYLDADADGYGSADTETEACERPSGYSETGDDCDDAEAAAFPDALETCDELDNDCNDYVDDGVTTRFYLDLDTDGFGGTTSVDACYVPAGHVPTAGDCDDTHDGTFPGGTEVCDELDNDCDNSTDEGVTTRFYLDADSDNFGGSTTVDACLAPVQHLLIGGDCTDDDPSIFPGVAENCDEVDNDCDGAVDEGVTTTYFADLDEDGRGDAAEPFEACTLPAGFAESSDDCDDTDASALPGGTELCDGVDNDCDGTVDDNSTSIFYADADGDKRGNPDLNTMSCPPPANYVSVAGDCDDSDWAVYSGAPETCDLTDNDCDGDVHDAGDIQVPGDYSGIQAAIDASASGDTICVAAGTYAENLEIDHPITLLSESGDSATILDGGLSGSVVSVRNTSSVKIEGFTLRNGLAASCGGGLYAYRSPNVEIGDSTITSNEANRGGGLCFVDASDGAKLVGSMIEENSSDDDAGGILVQASKNVVISENVIRNNYAFDSAGGIYLDGATDVLLVDNSVTGNEVGARGGGMYCVASTYTNLATTVSGNTPDQIWSSGCTPAENY